jgi:hypothetical protein
MFLPLLGLFILALQRTKANLGMYVLTMQYTAVNKEKLAKITSNEKEDGTFLCLFVFFNLILDEPRICEGEKAGDIGLLH